jgi:EAL domain-containing protein (putative c-di-GMP-specific phosphodiesterase class I)
VGLELEAVTLESAFRASDSLPANVLLNLNVSPALVLAGEPLGSILRRWGWQTILELTEHHAVEDYEALRAAIRRLGPTVRLAIDDAGAGFASFRHILELAPDFVKLDRAIIAGIEADPARQALVAGMRHFAVATGCGLIAEGIETDTELTALRSLGISLGQGYHLGRPEAPGPIASAGLTHVGSHASGLGNGRPPTTRARRLRS